MTFKDVLKEIGQHFRFLHHMGSEAKFSVKAFFPLFIAVFLPLVYPLLISLTYYQSTVIDRSAVVLDMDNSAITRQLTLDMDATQGMYIKRMVNTIDEGYDAVMSREADAFIFFPDDFTEDLKRFEQGNLKVYVYATNMMTYASVLGAIQTTVLDKNVDIAVERIANPKGLVGEKAYNTLDPVKYDKRVLYSPSLSYAEYICPVLFTLVFHQMGLLMLAFSIGFHREVKPEFARRSLWMMDYFGRFLYYVPFFVLGMCAVYYGYCTIFDWPHGNRLELIKLFLLMLAANFPIAAMFASICKDRFTSFLLLLPTTLIIFSYSGYVWPIYSMPEWAPNFMKFLVEPYVASSMRKIAFKGATLADCHTELMHMWVLFWVYLPVSLLVIHRNWLVLPFKSLWAKLHTTKVKPETETKPA